MGDRPNEIYDVRNPGCMCDDEIGHNLFQMYVNERLERNKRLTNSTSAKCSPRRSEMVVVSGRERIAEVESFIGSTV